MKQHLQHSAMNLLPHLGMLPQKVNWEMPVLAAISGSPRAGLGTQIRFLCHHDILQSLRKFHSH